ncbi:Cyclin-L1 [Armadillidium vulgare]|nr:Cyclin-L1 [Armadillidium vulgare]
MATGQVLFQRFYYSKSFVRCPVEITAMACITLAWKMEVGQMEIRNVINVFNHMKQFRNGEVFDPVILDRNYVALKNQVIRAETRLLKELGFCCHVKLPHKISIMYLRFLLADDNKKFVQSTCCGYSLEKPKNPGEILTSVKIAWEKIKRAERITVFNISNMTFDVWKANRYLLISSAVVYGLFLLFFSLSAGQYY